MDYVGVELVKDLQNGSVFKCKKKKAQSKFSQNGQSKSLLQLGFDRRQLSEELFERNSIKERKLSHENRRDYNTE